MNLLQACLLGGAAFRDVGDLLTDLSLEQSAKLLPLAPYTLGQLLAHLHATMRVSLDLATDQAEAWPDDLDTWPEAPSDQAALDTLLSDLKLMLAEANMLAADPSRRTGDILTDLAVHNAYHWGQIALLRQQQGTVFDALDNET